MSFGSPPHAGASAGCLVVDDHPVVREGLRRILAQAPGLTLIGEASRLEEAIPLVGRARPEVALVDTTLPDAGAVESTRRLRRLEDPPVVVLFADLADPAQAARAVAAGAFGMLGKTARPRAIVEALLRAAGRPLPAGDPVRAPTPRRALSSRECQVLQMLADGCSSRDVSERLVLSQETVKTHVKNILAKLEAGHRAQAVAIGLRLALIR